MKQWTMVGLVLAGIALGVWGLTRFAPPPEGAAMGRRAPDYRVARVSTGDSVCIRSD